MRRMKKLALSVTMLLLMHSGAFAQQKKFADIQKAMNRKFKNEEKEKLEEKEKKKKDKKKDDDDDD